MAKLPTRFLPAERATTPDLMAARTAFLELPRLSEVLDAMPALVFVLDPHRQILFANRAAREALDGVRALDGLRFGEAVGCVHAEELPGGCGTTESCTLCGAGCALAAAAKGRAQRLEARIRRAGREDLELEVWATPFHPDGVEVTLLAALDVGHEKRRQALERLFFHDVLNTAACLRGLAEEIEAAPKDAAALVPHLSAYTRRLMEEIGSQRDLSELESGAYPAKPVAFRVRPFLESLVSLYQSHEASRGKHLVLLPGAPDVSITADHTLLGRVVGNMIKNALEAEKADALIQVGCRPEKDGLCFWVLNPSVMPREVQLQMFQRFFSTKGTGRGLGTYSIKLLTERYLHGSATFSSEAKTGTEFRAVVPLAPPPAA